MVTKKKKIVFQSDSSFAKTGFGRHSKEILLYLHRTGKYDIIEYCCSKNWSRDIEHQRKPWKSFGALPDNPNEFGMIAPDDNAKRIVAYGAYNLDKLIYQEKPDVYIAVQDIWGIDFAVDKPWFNKITSLLWTTLDSLPILKSALEIAPKVKNYWVWSNFAEKAMKKLGHDHVRTVHGAIDDSKFFKLDSFKRKELRNKFQIPEDSFVVGFVFRNQPRKSVPNLLKGFKDFVRDNPSLKNPRLLLHTFWQEGWRIHELADEIGLDKKLIITTYICSQCKEYSVKEYSGDGVACPCCKNQKSYTTTNVGNGVSEEQLNEIYNLMDVYAHPFNSGGQELPIQEAKLAELVTLVTSYSCGEESSAVEVGSLPLDWIETREPDSQFIKAVTLPSSITKQLNKVLKMSPQQRNDLGRVARKWVIDNFSPSAVGKIVEKFIDEAPFTDFDFKQEQKLPNPVAQIEENESNLLWVIGLYKNILNRDVDKYDSGVRNWIHLLSKGANKEHITNHFRQEAAKILNQEKKKELFSKISKEDGKKILYVMPGSERDVFLSTALFKSIKEQYPEHKLYVATLEEYKNILSSCEYVHEVIDFYPEMENSAFMEGNGPHNGYFDVLFIPHVKTQRIISYIHNGESNIALDIKNAHS